MPLAAILIWWLIVKGSYKKSSELSVDVARVSRLHRFRVSLAARLGAVAVGLVKPTFTVDHAFLFAFVAVIGTTISPYMQVYVQSSVVEKGVTPDNYNKTKIDVWAGTVFAILIVFFIVVSTAATLHKAGIQVNTATDAAHALRPLAGRYAQTLFGLGLFGASMLAARCVAARNGLLDQRGARIRKRRVAKFS